jgi:hypothetical protein
MLFCLFALFVSLSPVLRCEGGKRVKDLQLIKLPKEPQPVVPTICSLQNPVEESAFSTPLAALASASNGNSFVMVPRFENLLQLLRHPRWFALLDKQFGYLTLPFPLSLENVTYFDVKALVAFGLLVDGAVAASSASSSSALSLGYPGFANLDHAKHTSPDGTALTFPSMCKIYYFVLLFCYF